jgi:hypothetical protein
MRHREMLFELGLDDGGGCGALHGKDAKAERKGSCGYQGVSWDDAAGLIMNAFNRALGNRGPGVMPWQL